MGRFTRCRGCGLGCTWAELIAVGHDGYCGELCRAGVRWTAEGAIRLLPPGWQQDVKHEQGGFKRVTLRNERGTVVFRDADPSK